jgi:hypothetical protein
MGLSRTGIGYIHYYYYHQYYYYHYYDYDYGPVFCSQFSDSIWAKVPPALFPGVKWQGRGVDNPPSSGAEVKESVELYLQSSTGPS